MTRYTMYRDPDATARYEPRTDRQVAKSTQAKVTIAGTTFVPVVPMDTSQSAVAKSFPEFAWDFPKPNADNNPRKGQGLWACLIDGKLAVAAKSVGGSKGAYLYECVLTKRRESWAGLCTLAGEEERARRKTPRAPRKPKTTEATATEATATEA